MIWTEKYRPACLKDIIGQDDAVFKLKFFVQTFGKKKRAMILHGPPGIGKTTLAYALAQETNSEIFELNASDLRNRESLKNVLKPAIEQQSLKKANKIILVDEADGISEVDYGGLQELLNAIDYTTYPMIITANDIWDKKFSNLRKKCELVQMKELNVLAVKQVLLEILKKETLSMEEDFITQISIKAKGDLRAAINDLQTLSKLKDYFSVILDERNKGEDIFNVMKKIFKEKPTNEILSLLDSVNMPLDDVMLWLEENIPLEYQNEELARAYDLLSKADIFKGRIYKQQYWRFLVYQNIFLSYGISSSKKSLKPNFTAYKKPTRILQIWMNNQKTIYKKSICEKYSAYVHVGQKRAMSEFSIIKQIIKTNEDVQKELKLSEDEIEYVKL